MTTEQLITASEIARALGAPLHRVNYVLATRDIEPVRRVGIIRAYPAEAADQVRQELLAIAVNRGRAVN